MSEKAKLGEILVAAGLIDEFQLSAALDEQVRYGNRLGETLVRLGYLTEAELVRTLSRHYGIPGVHLEGKEIEPDVLELLSLEVAEKYRCIPLFRKRVGGGEILYLGMADPGDLSIVDDVSFRTGLPVRPVLVGPIQIGSAIASFYRGESSRANPLHDGFSALREAPVEEGDTAPLLTELQQVAPEPVREPKLSVESPRAEARGPRTDETKKGSAARPPGAQDKPRDVPTREILRALTQLLIEKRVLSREELLERIAANKG